MSDQVNDPFLAVTSKRKISRVRRWGREFAPKVGRTLQERRSVLVIVDIPSPSLVERL